MDNHNSAESLARNVARATSGAVVADEVYERAVEAIEAWAPHYNWVGIYKVEGGDLVLAAWLGPQATEHVRIPMSEGICGLAATEGETVVVDDVNADPRYLACFPQTKSEIVVPIMDGERTLAEIDIDSDTPAAFGEEDRVQLEKAARVVAEAVRRASAANENSV